MPPTPSNQPKDTTVYQGQLEEIDPSINRILCFYDIDAISLALEQEGFDEKELIEAMIGLIRDPDPKVRKMGLAEFRAYRGDLLKVNGLLVKASQSSTSVDSKGNVTTQKVTAQGFLESLRKVNKNGKESTAGAHQHTRPQVGVTPGSADTADRTDGGDTDERADLSDGTETRALPPAERPRPLISPFRPQLDSPELSPLFGKPDVQREAGESKA